MEFPQLGKQCEVEDCRQLDYLYFECSGCRKIVCDRHHPPEDHSCPSPPIKDEQVVCCPLCAAPIPGRKGGDPNIRVNDHIASGCRSAPKTTSQPFSKNCSMKGCKKKSVVLVTCPTCQWNYCVAHRHEADHECPSPPSRPQQASSWANIFPSMQVAAPAQPQQATTFQRNSAPNSRPATRSPASSAPAADRKQLERERLERQRQKSSPLVAGGANGNASPLQDTDLTEEEQLAIALQNSLDDQNKQQHSPPQEDSSTCNIS